ncbi:MAG: M15 family metallopeptidase [Mariprofundus sp.]|nr:M15 family metallopeptidase [Mariprofundus sp.]
MSPELVNDENGKLSKGTVKDVQKLDGLKPEFKAKVDQVFDELTDKGYNLRVIWGRRTLNENNALVAKGMASRRSLHLKGLAVDFVERSIGYNNADHPEYNAAVQQAAEHAGVRWGGSFKSRWDPNHIQAR